MQVLFLKIIQKWYEPDHRERDFNALQLKNLLHRDQELFDKANRYIREYY